MSDARHHVLVLPERDAAEEVAEGLTARFPTLDEPELVRDALAGEDDAEDAQWLVVLDDPDGVCDPRELDQVAQAHDGWLER
ncbi:hypothetical protein ACFV3R_03030 [Streptomyces sp. NPDC059740]|uniref:hypothetical protein n=1 Tax=Streptomyces sp. NPDC059740 TaxID=3346926 RepID=UPI0036531170